jgi:hypothetical protein
MASIIRIKRSEVAGNPTVLAAGELAYSGLLDNGSNGGDRLYIGTGTETNGNAVNHVVIGGKYFTDMLDHARGTLTASSALIVDADSKINQFNVDNLRLDGNALTSTDENGNILITPNGSGKTIISNIWPDTDTSLAEFIYDIVGGAVIAGTGVTVTNNDEGNTTTISIGQDVSTTSNVTFNNVTVNGTLNSDDITSTNISVTGNATITGNLTVSGTTTTVNSTTVAITDLNLELAKDATTAAEANGAGITVTGPEIPATLTYTSADNRWNLNKDLNVARVYGTATNVSNSHSAGTYLIGDAFDGTTARTWSVDATSANTASKIVARDASGDFSAGIITAALNGNATTATTWQTARDLTISGDATATFTGVNGSAAVDAAITLATVNANPGAFGDGYNVPTVTVNAKGLVTAVSTTPISIATAAATSGAATLGLAKFDSANFIVDAGWVSIATVDGGTY